MTGQIFLKQIQNDTPLAGLDLNKCGTLILQLSQAVRDPEIWPDCMQICFKSIYF